VVTSALAYSKKKIPPPPTQNRGHGNWRIVVVTHNGIVEFENTIPGVTNAET
jgi:hypothetical protein